MGDHHTADLLRLLGNALREAADDLLDGDEGRAAERLRLVHEAIQAAEPVPTWEDLALVLEPYVAQLRPPADADDSWPYHEHLDDLSDEEDEAAPANLAFPLGKVN